MTDGRDESGAGQGGVGQGDTENAAERVIARFGGIRPMAAKLGVAVSTVQGWKARGVIPVQRHEQVRSAAAAQGLEVPREDLEAAVPASESGSQEPATLAAAVPPPPREQVPDDRQTDEGPPEGEEGGSDEAGTSLETEQSDQTPWRSVGAEGNGHPAQPSRASSEAETGDSGRGTGGSSEPPPAAPAARPSPIPAMLLGAVLTAAGAVVAVLLSDLWIPARESPSASAVAALELRTARLEEQRLETSPEGLRELERALEAMREQIDALNEAVGATGDEAAAQGPTVEDIEALRSVTTQLNDRLNAFEATANDRAGGLEGRLEELGARIEEVAQSPAEADSQTLARLEGLDGRLEGAAGRIEGLEARLQSTLQEFEAARVRVGEETALALAAGQLREAFRTGRPFRTEMEGLRRLGSEENGLDAALAPLEAHADAGVPTLAALQASFSDAAARAVTAARAEGAGDEWQALFWNRLSDLVTVRAVGEPQGEDAESVVARAERRLESEDLPAALQELEALEGAAADAMADWMARARARLEAEAGLAALGQVTLGRVSQEPETVDGGEG